MKCSILHKITVLILLVAGIAPLAAGAYPPDNAAVLYYKTCLMYHAPEAEVKEELDNVIAGKSKPSEKLVAFIEGQDHIVEVVRTAAQITNCDWGHDFRKGFMMLLPGLADMRNISKTVLADAVILSQKGDYSAAFDRCIATYRVAQHVKDRVIIDNLVGIAIEKATMTVVRQILATSTVEAGKLRKLKNALDEIASEGEWLTECLEYETDVVTKHTTPEELFQIVIMESGSDVKASDYDEDLAKKAIAYYKQHMDKMIIAMDLPYKRAIPEIKKLVKKIDADAKDKPEVMLANAVVPGIESILGTDVKARTDINVLRAAIEIYQIKAATGKLPPKLPAGMRKDMFSGKDFEYSVTRGGFVLKCRAKNLKADKIEEYEFGIAE